MTAIPNKLSFGPIFLTPKESDLGLFLDYIKIQKYHVGIYC